MTNYQMIICPTDDKKAGYIEGVQTLEIKKNGDYSFRPGEGFQGLAGVDVSVEIPKIKVADGIKFGYSSEVDTSKYDWSGVTDFSYMFYNAAFSTVDLTGVVSPKATNMSNMFYGCKQLIEFDDELNKMDTSNVTSMNTMFGNCGGLLTLNPRFDTSNVTDFNYMFRTVNSVTSMDLSSFDTSKAEQMVYMFSGCIFLVTLDISNFNMDNTGARSRMFQNCNRLTEVKVINCNDSTKQKILTQLQTDLSSYTWTLGDDGIIRRS